MWTCRETSERNAQMNMEILKSGTAVWLAPQTRRPKIASVTDLYQNLPLELRMRIYVLGAPLDSKSVPPELANYRHIYQQIIKEQYPRSNVIFPLQSIPQGTMVNDGILFPGRTLKDHLQWIKVLKADVFASTKLCQDDLRVYVRGKDPKKDKGLFKTILSRSNISNILLIMWRIHGFPGQPVHEQNEVWLFLNHIPLHYLEEVEDFLNECADNMRVSSKYENEKTAWRYDTEFKAIGMAAVIAKIAVWNILANGIHSTARKRTAKLREAAELRLYAETADQLEKQPGNKIYELHMRWRRTTTFSTPACRSETEGPHHWHFPSGDRTIRTRVPKELAAAGYWFRMFGSHGNGHIDLLLATARSQGIFGFWTYSPHNDRYKMFQDILSMRRQGVRTTFAQWMYATNGDASHRITRYPFWHWMHWKMEDDETLGILGMEMRTVENAHYTQSRDQPADHLFFVVDTVGYSISYSVVATFEMNAASSIENLWFVVTRRACLLVLRDADLRLAAPTAEKLQEIGEAEKDWRKKNHTHPFYRRHSTYQLFKGSRLAISMG